MRVSAWSNGESTYGIRVGFPNRKSYFGKWENVEVEIDGEVHRFGLTNGFWDKCPEIRDRGGVIREWLRRHHTLEWRKGNPPEFELIPLGENRFRLEPSIAQ